MNVLSVGQLNRIIKDLIDNEVILEDIVVTGELSSFSVTRNIAYFTLKDSDNLLNCVQFGCKTEFKIGDMVQCRGNVKYYPKGGKLTFNALTIETCGQGELYQKFIELKEKLAKEGLFDVTNKIPIPKFINSIGVVTSKTGAVLQDIKNVTSRRNPNLDIYVYDAQVQGRFAVQDIIQGITYFDNMSDVDVIVVARGGGSIEDLMPFNDEELARIAYICNKPIISAVGHETDFSILDFVADLRAPTPSAAAELVTFDSVEMKRYVKETFLSIQNYVINQYSELNAVVNLTLNEIDRQVEETINEEMLFLFDLTKSMDKNIDKLIDQSIYRVKLNLNTLDKLNPSKLLLSGYSCVTINGKALNFKDTRVGDNVEIETHDAKYKATILEKEKKC
ncbi:MAG: exodeoxyribonuclease VII large subunit [Clostridia bacterium]|nr:exodeoxyribonuclease VII large subunit [Clostridia bacterium]